MPEKSREHGRGFLIDLPQQKCPVVTHIRIYGKYQQDADSKKSAGKRDEEFEKLFRSQFFGKQSFCLLTGSNYFFFDIHDCSFRS